jgi:NitT/TauT family transport system substrate-binding protein
MESLKPYKEGKADAAFMVFADALMFESEGTPTCAVYITEYSETGDMIVGQPTLNSLSDLKGKKVSFEGFNSFSHLFVLKLLEKAGVREGEFEGSNLDSSKVLEHLQAGNLSAGHVYGPAVSEALAKGYKMLGQAGDIRHLMMGGLVVNAKVVNTRREEVQGVVKALVEAADWLQHFPKEGFSIIAKYAGISKEELETSIKRLHVLTLPENQDMLKKGGPLFEGGKEIIDFFYQKGVLVKIPDLNTVIDGQFVAAIGKQP